jgi:phage tail sheath protein FI
VPTYLTPGIYVQEVSGGVNPIEGVGTATAGFVGVAPNATANVNEAVPIENWTQFRSRFVGDATASTPLSHAVFGFLRNGGRRCYVVNVGPDGSIAGAARGRAGLQVLEGIDEIAIVAAPGYTDAAAYDALLQHCETLQDRVAVLDAPRVVSSTNALTRVVSVPAPAPAGSGGGAGAAAEAGGDGEGEEPGLRARESAFGAYYFPWLQVADPLAPQTVVEVPPSGHVAGIWARTDGRRGVHKAPANEVVMGALGLTYRVTDAEQAELNPRGVNCIRFFAREGIRVWGARTLAASSSEWRYLNVRRLFNMIEESIAESTRWIVFEPNDVTLWKSIRRDVSAFLTRLWRDGALMGTTPEEAFFVQCDSETNPPEVIDAGEVHTVIGVAPVKPAEFIVFRISQSAVGAALASEGE